MEEPLPRAATCRFLGGPARVAFLLALLVAALGLVAWAPVPDRPLADTGKETRLSGEDVPRTRQTASPEVIQEILAHPDLIPTQAHPLLGQQAPDLEHLERAGGPLVLIFYFGAHCKNCVRQLFDVQRDLPLFRAVGARVVAISADPPEVTRRLQQDGPFGFLVLSDPGNKLARAYQVFRADLLRHGTFLIDREGMVRWVNVGDAPFRRTSALLSQLARMEGRLPPLPGGILP